MRFSSIASVAKRITWTVAPDAYQKGPDTPYLYATLDDCNNVAAQVQDDTTAEETRPDLTVRPAVLKTSDVCNSLLYRRKTNVVNIIPKLRPRQLVYLRICWNSTYANKKPNPMTMPYPVALLSGGVVDIFSFSVLIQNVPNPKACLEWDGEDLVL